MKVCFVCVQRNVIIKKIDDEAIHWLINIETVQNGWKEKRKIDSCVRSVPKCNRRKNMCNERAGGGKQIEKE